MDDNFKSIVNGVLEGRVAYANIRKITYFLISCGLAEVLFYILSILFNLPMPLVAIQLLWLNVVTDGIQDIGLSFEKAEDNIMNEPPRNPKESLFDKNLLEEILISGICIGLLVFIVWYYLINVLALDIKLARTYIMALMIIIQNVHAFNCRSEKNSLLKLSIKSNPLFIIGVIASMLLGVAVLEIKGLSIFLKTTRLPYRDLLSLIVLSLSITVVMETYKKIKYRQKKTI